MIFGVPMHQWMVFLLKLCLQATMVMMRTIEITLVLTIITRVFVSIHYFWHYVYLTWLMMISIDNRFYYSFCFFFPIVLGTMHVNLVDDQYSILYSSIFYYSFCFYFNFFCHYVHLSCLMISIYILTYFTMASLVPSISFH